MGLKKGLLAALFGGGKNVIAETAEVWRENSEAGAQRRAAYDQAVLSQFAGEFKIQRKGVFDRFVDGLNRLPRPLIVLATFLFFISAMFSPIWFAERMQGLILVPEPIWWLAGTIVAFYFGGRAQIKSHEFKRSLVQTAALVPDVIENIEDLRELRHDSPGAADTGTDTDLADAVLAPDENAALSHSGRG